MTLAETVYWTLIACALVVAGMAVFWSDPE